MTQAAKKPARPQPRIGAYLDTSAFWAGAREGRLMLQYDTGTGRYQHYPRPVSVFTGRKTLEWRQASGRGVVYSWTVTRSAWPGNEERVPYICAYVDLEEGVRVLCNLVDVGEDEVHIGMAVKVSWDHMTDEIAYPDFAPDRDAAQSGAAA